MDRERIRPIAICLFRHDNRILVEEHPDSSKQDYFCRPLGGAIEFGEHSREAIVREIKEELGADITNLHLIGVLENRFVYEGQPGHEIVFVYDAQFLDRSLYHQEVIEGYEHGNSSPITAHWRSPEQIEQSKVRLVPEGLIALRTHQEDAKAYAALKYHLAEKYRDDRLSYTNGKAPFIWEIMAKADQWNQEIGWQPGSLDA